MSDDGHMDDSIVVTTFQGLNTSGALCLLEITVMGFGRCRRRRRIN
jgi:hypothetical protein